MAIDPNKMAAFASSGPKPGTEDSQGGDAAETVPGEDTGEDNAPGGSDRFSELAPLLAANTDELAACCDELDPDALTDTSTALADDNLEILTESVMALPEDLLSEMMATLSGITPEEADTLTAPLEDDGSLEDAAPVSALLVHIGKLIESGDLSLEADEEDDDEGSETDDEESDEDEAAEGSKPSEGE